MGNTMEPNQPLLFIVRVWPGAAGQVTEGRRGKAQQAGSDAWCYFSDWNALIEFLRRQVEAIEQERGRSE